MGEKRDFMVEEITQELKDEIYTDGLVCDIPVFAPFAQERILEGTTGERKKHLEQCKYCAELLEATPVNYKREVSSYHPSLGVIVKPVKRVIRKMVRFLLEPMVEEINTGRHMTTVALLELQECVQEQENSLSVMSEILTQMRAEMDVLKADHAYLKELVQTYKRGRQNK